MSREKLTQEQTVGITFGLMGKPIPEQLKEQGFVLDDTGNHRKSSRGRYMEEMRTAFNRLRMSGFLTNSESDKVNKRMMKYIVAHLKRVVS